MAKLTARYRFTIDLGEEMALVLQRIMDEDRITRAEAIRRALASYDEQRKDGERNDG